MSPRDRPRLRNRQRGGITLLLVLVLLVIAAMAGGLAVRGSTSELRMAGAQRESRTRFYCAEAGINAARATFATNFGQWNIIFSGGVPGFTYPVTGDIDQNGQPDYSVTLIDNPDEFPPAAPNAAQDNDLTAIMISTCTSTTLTGGPRELRQIVTFSGNLGFDYRFQAGHSTTHSGNTN